MKIWLDKDGVVKPAYEKKFDRLQGAFRAVLERLNRKEKMYYRELYDIAQQAAASAVGDLVREEANRKKKRRKSCTS